MNWDWKHELLILKKKQTESKTIIQGIFFVIVVF